MSGFEKVKKYDIHWNPVRIILRTSGLGMRATNMRILGIQRDKKGQSYANPHSAIL